METGGYFVFKDTLTGTERRVKNTLVDKGAEAFLKSIFLNNALPTPIFMGLSGSPYTFNSNLAAISVGEPVGNGYIRASMARSGAVWDASLINGIWRAQSVAQQFVCTAPWTKTWIRAFLATTVDNTGDLWACSGPLMAQEIVTPANPPLVSYEFWLRP